MKWGMENRKKGEQQIKVDCEHGSNRRCLTIFLSKMQQKIEYFRMSGAKAVCGKAR